MKHFTMSSGGDSKQSNKKDFNQITLDKIINGKQQVEWTMAKALLNEFNDKNGLIHNGLKALVLNAIDEIVEIWEDKGESIIEMAYYKDAVNYTFVKSEAGKFIFRSHKHFYEKLKDAAYLSELSTADLGSLIRFYGEVIECGVHLGSKGTEDDKDWSWLKKPTWDLSPNERVKLSAQQSFVGRFEPLVAKMKSYQRFGADDPLHSSDGGFWDKSESGQRQRKKASKYTAKELMEIRLKNTTVERALIKVKGGISRWIQLPEDLLNKIDLVFGLSHGATISGTTADNIFFINRMSLLDIYLTEVKKQPALPDWRLALYEGWDINLYKEGKGKWIVYRDKQGKIVKEPYVRDLKRGEYSHHGFYGVDPVYYMLPLGTIAGEAHHTTSEIALPLAINLNYDAEGNLKQPKDQLFKYAIGRYKDLLPKRGEARELSPGLGLGKIEEILTTAQIDHRNRLVLIYYKKPKEIGGYILFDESDNKDLQVWSELAKTNKKMMDKFKGFAPYPTKQNIESLHPAIRILFGARKEQVKTGAQEGVVEKMANKFKETNH